MPVTAVRSGCRERRIAAAVWLYIADGLGLGHPFGSRLELQERERPGHEKPLHVNWTLARFVDDEDLPEGTDFAQVRAARRALECAPIADLLAAAQEPLTSERFLKNMAFAVTSFTTRFDPDPIGAAAHCT